MHDSSIRAVWTDALFVSAQHSGQPSAGQLEQAVAAGILGPRGCAEWVAQEFGDHPETAVTRMRWARKPAAEAVSGWKPGVAPAPGHSHSFGCLAPVAPNERPRPPPRVPSGARCQRKQGPGAGRPEQRSPMVR
jgi:hypothetical protein